MSTNRGIFETFPNQPANHKESPFAVVNDPVDPNASAPPFAVAGRAESPFTVVEDASDQRPVEPGRPAKVPERRRPESPFQMAEPAESFGFEAPAKPAQSRFEVATSHAPQAPSPFTAPPQPAPASPFSIEPTRQAAPFPQAAPQQPAATWPESTTAFSAAPAVAPQAFAPQAPPAFTQQAVSQPAAAAPVPSVFAPPFSPASGPDSHSDSFSIRQLELRAIFGVDREMTPDEILQRSRALPGMRNIARVGAQEMATLEALKTLLPNLGFGGGHLAALFGLNPAGVHSRRLGVTRSPNRRRFRSRRA